jgi:hypothetical protein
MPFEMSDPLVVVVYRNSQTLLGRILLYDILVEFRLDLCRDRQPVTLYAAVRRLFLFEKRLAQIYALITYIDFFSYYDLAYLRAGFAAE